MRRISESPDMAVTFINLSLGFDEAENPVIIFVAVM
jgi:hypothetical protein